MCLCPHVRVCVLGSRVECMLCCVTHRPRKPQARRQDKGTWLLCGPDTGDEAVCAWALLARAPGSLLHSHEPFMPCSLKESGWVTRLIPATLARWLGWLEHHLVHQKVVGSIPGQVCMYRRQPINVSHTDVSLFGKLPLHPL